MHPLCSANEAFSKDTIQYPLKFVAVSVKPFNIISDVFHVLIWNLPCTVFSMIL